ncbi:hypothetical protein R6Q59_029960 [Mikania micrantha]
MEKSEKGSKDEEWIYAYVIKRTKNSGEREFCCLWLNCEERKSLSRRSHADFVTERKEKLVSFNQLGKCEEDHNQYLNLFFNLTRRFGVHFIFLSLSLIKGCVKITPCIRQPYGPYRSVRAL